LKGKRFLDEAKSFRDMKSLEKMKKEKRSVRGRTLDDWLLSPQEFKKLKKNFEEHVQQLVNGGLRYGRIIEVQKRNVFLAEEDEKGMPITENLWLCSIAKRHFQRAHKERNFVVVGDRVLFAPDTGIEFDDDGEPTNTDLPRGVVQHAFARTSQISRQDPLNAAWDHVMLANIDLVVIVASVLHPEVRFGLLDRFLVQSEQEELPAVIVLNKVDLLQNPKLATPAFLQNYHNRIKIYRDIGYEVLEICALKPKTTKEAITRLRQIFKGKIVGFAGHSGVGKSSIVNLMKPEFEQIVDEDPAIFYKGRHTTTYNSLLHLGIGAYAIDTPGVRSFHMKGIGPQELSACFREFRPFACMYRECAHDKEEGCAIKKAVQEGQISRERYRSYLGILKGISFREGEGDDTDALMIADLKAREQVRDNNNKE